MEELWTEKYQPTKFDELDFHDAVNKKLENLTQNGNMPHMIIYGPDGAGKRTRVNCLLHALYGNNIKTNKETWSTKNNNTLIELNIRYSKYHYELSPSDVKHNDRIVLLKLIKESATNSSFFLGNESQNSFITFVVYNAHKLSLGAQAALRRTLEKYSNKIRVVMVCETLGPLIPALKSRCLLLRMKAPETGEIRFVLEDILKKEKVREYKEIVNHLCVEEEERNLRALTLLAQNLYLTSNFSDGGSKFFWKREIENNIVKKILANQSVDMIKDFRTVFYKLLVNQIPADDIIKEMLVSFCKNNNNKLKTLKAKEDAARCDRLMKRGHRDIIYLESFLVKLMMIQKNG